MKDSSILGLMGNLNLPKGIKPNLLDKYIYSNIRGANTDDIKYPLYYRWFLFSNTILRMDVFNEVDLFDTTIRHYGGEDTELALRIFKSFPQGLRYNKSLISYHHDQKKLSKFSK